MGRTLLRCLLFLMLSLTAHAQDIPPKVRAILSQTMSMSASAQLTEQMHQEFWEAFRQLGDPGQIQILKNSLAVNLLGAQEYQKEVWRSAKLSFEQQRVVKSERMSELEQELPARFEQTLVFASDEEDRQAGLRAFNDRFDRNKANAASMLTAAAKHASMLSAQGKAIRMDQETIEAVLVNLDARFERLNRLLSEDWQ